MAYYPMAMVKIGSIVSVTIPGSAIVQNVRGTVTDVIRDIFDRSAIISLEIQFRENGEPCKLDPSYCEIISV